MRSLRRRLLDGIAIPACPLALHEDGRWSERHQSAVLAYYRDAGAGGVAVGVHTTQFEIRAPGTDLFTPILELCASRISTGVDGTPMVKVAGICGETHQAVAEAELATRFGYEVGLLSLAALQDWSESAIAAHCRRVAEVMPLFGFYLQPAVGGRDLSYSFWREFAEIDEVVAIKIAAFDRYRTLDVVRAVVDAGREDICLYTGNDDNIIADLLTPFSFDGSKGRPGEKDVLPRYFSGGLLGQWAVWTSRAVELLSEIQAIRTSQSLDPLWLTRNAQLTDANSAIFDAANGFSGCIPGINEILRRQGLLPSSRCLNPAETLSRGQEEAIERVVAAYPWLVDDAFVKSNLDRWLRE